LSLLIPSSDLFNTRVLATDIENPLYSFIGQAVIYSLLQGEPTF